MTIRPRRAWWLAIALAVPAAFGGCGGGEEVVTVEPPEANSVKAPPRGTSKVPENPEGQPVGAMGGPPPGGGMGGPPPGMGGPPTGIRAVMRKVAGGPNSLTPKLEAGLKADEPKWDEIQAQAKEYAALAKELGTYDPPKGSKESWTKLTGAFADTAAGLDKAAQAKDMDAAKTARGQLQNSCAACHKEHQIQRGMGRGFGGPGGGMGGPPPGGGMGGPPPKDSAAGPAPKVEPPK